MAKKQRGEGGEAEGCKDLTLGWEGKGVVSVTGGFYILVLAMMPVRCNGKILLMTLTLHSGWAVTLPPLYPDGVVVPIMPIPL
jgi:hypothetical protein